MVVIIESGPEADPNAHARLRRDTVHLWSLEASLDRRPHRSCAIR
jgi:hypothetical protein